MLRYFLALTALLFAALRAHTAEVIPYLEAPTPHAITVNWITDEEGSPVVHLGRSQGLLDIQVNGTSQHISGGAEDYYYHTVRLEGLEALNYYFYSVECGEDTSDVYRFRTQPETDAKHGIYRVLVMGDHQLRDDPRYLELATRARKKIETLYGEPLESAINLCLNVGDQVDVGTPDHYRNVHFARSVPVSPNVAIQTTVGNHETYGTPGISLYSDLFDYKRYSYQGVTSNTERYYAYQFADILFVHLDSESPGTAQTQWLSQLATAAATDDSVDWMVSMIHRPYQAEQYVGDISSWFRNTGMPILNTSGKHALNIGAHHHLYARGQVRDQPVYHIISGGTAWDQYWGQSTEEDLDDVTKTIANWTWQIIEIDLDERTMKVDCYSEGHPLMRFVYDSIKVDSFTRRLGLAAPNKPVMEDDFEDASQTLPLTLHSSSYSSSTEETIYSTQFQIAKTSDFSRESLDVDLIRDIEDYYGDTGEPDYTPVDVNADVDIFNYTVEAQGLHNGSYYARVRHRDSNIEWSEWSDAVSFTVVGSTDADPSLKLDKALYQSGDTVTVTYKDGHGEAKDWLGVYRVGENPADVQSQVFSYVNVEDAKNGTVSFSDLAPGQEYYVGFFSNDGYEEMAERVSFYLGATPSLAPNKTQYVSGDDVLIDYAGAPGGEKDWIGIYHMGDVPGDIESIQWEYTPKESGEVSFSGLSDGFYFVVFFINDGYTEVSERAVIQIGDAPAVVTTGKKRYEVDEHFQVHFAGGAGTAKDYIGVFQKDAVDLGSQGNELVAYQYIGGVSAGSIVFNQSLPKGQYFLSLFINDSYTEISNRIYFGVGEDYVSGPRIELAKSKFKVGELITLSYFDGPGFSKDWIGIYREGDTPGNGSQSVVFKYVDADHLSEGSVSITDGLSVGNYYAAFFSNDSYTEIADRVSFSVEAPEAMLLLDADHFISGDPIKVHYSQGPGSETDWIAIYRVGQTPGSDSPSRAWSYVDPDNPSSGSVTFNEDLVAGDYFVSFLADGGYTELADRVEFTVGAERAALSLAGSTFNHGEQIVVSYSNGPGNEKDWIGIYQAGQKPGADSPSQLWDYVDAAHPSDGSVSFIANLPVGRYFVAFLENNGYAEIAERIDFQVTTPTSIRYSEWTESRSFENADAAAMEADPDHDGSNNLVEYLIGSDPLHGDGASHMHAKMLNKHELEVTFTMRASERDVAVLILQLSADLKDWSERAIDPNSTEDDGLQVKVQNNGNFDTVTVNTSISEETSVFVRLSAKI